MLDVRFAGLRPDPTAGQGSGPGLTGIFSCGLAVLLCLLALSVSACPVPREIRAAPPAPAGEVSMATFNLWNHLGHSRNGRPLASELVQTRSREIARWIRTVLGAPHLVALQEIGAQSILDQLTEEIRRQGGPDYSSRISETNDPSGIRLGILYRNPVKAGTSRALFADRRQGTHWLFSRPPLWVEISEPLSLDLVVMHLRSGRELHRSRVQQKRKAQADYLARWMRERKYAGHQVILVGDMNSAPDTGDYAEPYNVLMQKGWFSAWERVAEEDRFSYIFKCQRQAIDHILVPESLRDKLTRAAVTRGNAGRYEELFAREAPRAVISDHDALLVYFRY